MKKLITITSIALALSACGPEESGGYDLTFKITEANAKDALSSSIALTNTAEGFTSFDDLLSYSTPERSLQTRATESATFDCDVSGSMTLSATVPDAYLDADEMPASGQLSISTTFNNCDDGWETTDGGMSVSMSWSGYNDAEESFASLTVGIDFDDLQVNEDSESSKLDGEMDLSIGSTAMSFSWDLYAAGTEFGGQALRTRTVQAISIGLDDQYPSSGLIRVEGADDTYAEAKVVANGYEISVNGGQATLYTWDEI